MNKVVSVTRKGQATIPKALRDKYGVGDKVLVAGVKGGILIKPLPRPEEEFGSLKKLFEGETAREILQEARAKDRAREKKLLERVAK